MIKRRFNVVFTILRPVFYLYSRLKYRLHIEPAPALRPGQPVLILANHNCALDPFFISASFRRPIFFVASDHIFRLGLASLAIRFLVAPIPIVKSQIDLRALRSIRETLGNGGAVGLFPEGNRSFSGITGRFAPSIGKLVKQLHCTVLLYQLKGGYLSTPRWSVHSRRGCMSGKIVRQLEPEALAGMTPEAIAKVIQEALEVDAFTDQRGDAPVRYRGRKLAESLERALFICPKCRRLDTLRSHGDHFACPCGLDVKYSEYGFFEPVDPWSSAQAGQGSFLETVAAWDLWQRQALAEWPDPSEEIDWSGQRQIFCDPTERLFSCERASRTVRLVSGQLRLFADRLEFNSKKGLQSFPLVEIKRMIVHGPQTLQFTTSQDQTFEVRSKLRRSAFKYVMLYNLLTQKQKGETFNFYGF